MTTHSNLSPSARHRWALCPGSVRESLKYPNRPSGLAAIEGTHDHTLLEKCIKEFHDARTYVGLILKDDDGEFIVDDERAERIQFALDYIERRANEMGEDVKVLSETRVNPESLVKRSDMSGTVDVQLLNHDTLEIVDYKGGMNPVEAKGNHQMEQYALGVIAETLGLQPLYIRMTIIQPKLRMRGMSGISTHTITLGELMEIKNQMILEAAATDDPKAPLVPGESQCKYCSHKGACSALSQKALGDSGIAFSNLDVSKQAADKEPTSMTDQQLREIIEAAPLVRQMIEAAEAEALRRIESGVVIEGVKAVRGRGSRGWSIADEEEMADKLKKFGMPKDVIWETKLISVAKAEKAMWTKRDGTKVQLTDRQLKTLKSEYTKTSEGKLTIAPSSDPRPAVTLSAAALFQPVEQAVTPELPSFLL